jgi:hypothetical protein
MINHSSIDHQGKREGVDKDGINWFEEWYVSGD